MKIDRVNLKTRRLQLPEFTWQKRAEKALDKLDKLDKFVPPGSRRDLYLGKAAQTGILLVPPEFCKLYNGQPLNNYEKLRITGYIVAGAGGAAGAVGAGAAGLALVIAGNCGQVGSALWKDPALLKQAAQTLRQVKEQGLGDSIQNLERQQALLGLKDAALNLADLGTSSFLGYKLKPVNPPPKPSLKKKSRRA